jgi:hypothetical protein
MKDLNTLSPSRAADKTKRVLLSHMTLLVKLNLIIT